MSDTIYVWAVPAKHSIIDEINPETGLTRIYGKDEAAVKAQDPDAVRMSWPEWQAAAVARQQAPITWVRSDARSYRKMLEVLPPAVWIGDAFMVGEAMDHCVATGRARYTAFWKRGADYYTASRPLTVVEFKREIGAQS